MGGQVDVVNREPGAEKDKARQTAYARKVLALPEAGTREKASALICLAGDSGFAARYDSRYVQLRPEAEIERLREQLKARDRELQALKMKLALSAGPSSDDGLTKVGDALVWTPRFEGLDRKAHAAVVDQFRNRHRERPFALLSASVADGGVHVIAAVSPLLAPAMKAPEVMKRLGLKGGGRPDFAQGGGVAPADVEGLRERATRTLCEMLEAATNA